MSLAIIRLPGDMHAGPETGPSGTAHTHLLSSKVKIMRATTYSIGVEVGAVVNRSEDQPPFTLWGVSGRIMAMQLRFPTPTVHEMMQGVPVLTVVGSCAYECITAQERSPRIRSAL